MNKNYEAFVQARQDITEDLKKDGKSYITCSLKSLVLFSLLTA